MSKRQKSPKIEPQEMVALWNCDSHGRITEFLIVPAQDFTQELDRVFESWWGKGVKNWETHGFRNKPAGLFAYLSTAHGFASEEIARTVLTQFAGVRRQRWAKLTRDWLDNPG